MLLEANIIFVSLNRFLLLSCTLQLTLEIFMIQFMIEYGKSNKKAKYYNLITPNQFLPLFKQAVGSYTVQIQWTV